MDETDLKLMVGQMFFVGIPGPELDQVTRDLLRDIRPGGVCLFARNIKDRSQVRHLLDGICDLNGSEPLLSLDQEGGRVDRLRRIMAPMPAASTFYDPFDAERFGRINGEVIRSLGFNMNFAPVVDVMDEERAHFVNGLTSRTFPGGPEKVAELAGAFLNGLRSQGILGTLKHFPGLGAARVDSHETLPEVDSSDDVIEDFDLLPFRLLLHNDSPTVMVAHASFPNSSLQELLLNGKILPSSLNRSVVTDLLRNELGFDGVAITDDLEMGAIVSNFGIAEACKLAVKAGEDMLAICASGAAIREGFDAVVSAVRSGELPIAGIERSVDRIEKLRRNIPDRLPLDLDRLDELSSEIEQLHHS